MDLNLDQPIVALASPPGGSRRGIVRLSGANLTQVVADWFEPLDQQEWTSARVAASHAGRLKLGSRDETTYCPVELYFWPGRRSYTGQPLIELHLPGSPSLLEAVITTAHRHGARTARPGEFTLRAFLAGRMDLLQAEAVLGIIDAGNRSELETALAQLAGGVSGQLTNLRRDLLELLADLEAGLDFIEEDIEFVSRTEVVERLTSATALIDRLRQQASDRMQSQSRRKVVLAGLPNAGKSTLFNRLTQSNVALVSPLQGTTRDFLHATITWTDLSFELIDTAGWEDAATGISAEAQRQRIEQFQQSDLLVWCTSLDLNSIERQRDDDRWTKAESQSRATMRVFTKADLLTQSERNTVATNAWPGAAPVVVMSAITEHGTAALVAALRAQLAADNSHDRLWLGLTAARCNETLELIDESVKRAQCAANTHEIGDELIAVDLRNAIEHLGEILGVIYTDDILDRIFSKFCIGK